MELAKVTSRGQITLPLAIRRKLDVKEGDKVVFYEENGRIVVEGATASTPVAVYDLSGKLVYTGVDTTVALPAGTYVVRVACKSSKVCVF